VFNIKICVHTLYLGPLSVRAQYSNLCPNNSLFTLPWQSKTLERSYRFRFRFRLFCDRRSIGQSVLVSGPHQEPMTRFLLLSDICGLHVVERPPWWEDWVSYSYNLLSLSSSWTTELVTTSHCLIWDSPNLERQVPVLISPRNRVAQLYPSALGSLFVASFDSQGYGGGILTQKWKSKLYYDLQSASQSVLVSVTHLGPATNFSHSLFDYYYLFFSISGLLMWGVLSDEKSGLYFSNPKSKLYYDRQSVGQSVLVSGTQLGPATSFTHLSLIIFFLQFQVCWFGAPCLTRSRVRTFQFLPGIASAAFLTSESHGTNEHSLLSIFF
jgi:hypothetical protein